MCKWSAHSLQELQLSSQLRAIKSPPTSVLPLFAKQFFAQLDSYQAGTPVCFDVPFELPPSTPFQRLVWEACQTIAWGKTVSYQHLAKTIGHPRAAQAVGNALGTNRLALVIPCHRVVARNNKLGGFSAGIHWKKQLLQREGCCLFES